MSVYSFHTLCSNAIAYLIATRTEHDKVYRCQEIELSNCRAVGEDRMKEQDRKRKRERERERKRKRERQRERSS